MSIEKIFEAITESAIADEAGDVRSILDELLPTPSKQDILDIEEYCSNLGMSALPQYSEETKWFYYD